MTSTIHAYNEALLEYAKRNNLEVHSVVVEIADPVERKFDLTDYNSNHPQAENPFAGGSFAKPRSSFGIII